MDDAMLDVRETDLAESLGLPIKRLRQLREAHLAPGDTRKEGAAVMYGAAAVGKIRAVLGLVDVPAAAVAASPEKTVDPEPAAEATPATLTGVVDRLFHNPRIVGIRVDGKPARLRVTDSRHFTKGLRCPVRLVAPPDLYELTCRAPRWRGKF